MLKSSSEYLRALRTGQYLLFLEWPRFIVAHYKMGAADSVVDLLVFEWLNNGFSEEDAKLIALLHKAQAKHADLFHSNLEYSLSMLSSAMSICLVYQCNNLQPGVLTKDPKNVKEIYDLMTSATAHVDDKTFKSYLMMQQLKFLEWIDEDKVKKVIDSRIALVYQDMHPIVDLRYCLVDYLDSLKSAQLPLDQLKSQRTSVIEQLALYLSEQTELSITVQAKITEFVEKIEELRPAEFEKLYLNKLSPPTLKDNVWQVVTDLGLSFFNMLQGPASPASTADVSKTPKAF